MVLRSPLVVQISPTSIERLHHFGCIKITEKVIQDIQAGLPKGIVVPRRCSRRLFNVNLKFRPAEAQHCGKYQGWSAEQWRSVKFSDKTLIWQFYAFCRYLRRPLKQQNNLRYIVPAVKNASKVMISAAIFAGGRSDQWFMPKSRSIYGAVYLEVIFSQF